MPFANEEETLDPTRFAHNGDVAIAFDDLGEEQDVIVRNHERAAGLCPWSDEPLTSREPSRARTAAKSFATNWEMVVFVSAISSSSRESGASAASAGTAKAASIMMDAAMPYIERSGLEVDMGVLHRGCATFVAPRKN